MAARTPKTPRPRPWTSTEEETGILHHYRDPHGWQVEMQKLQRELRPWYRAQISTPDGDPVLTMHMQLPLDRAKTETENRVASLRVASLRVQA